METISSIIPIGANFSLGKKQIGRNRLPAGMRAHLNDEVLLCGAIRDLYAYAMQPNPIKPIHSVVFRVIDEKERTAINYKIQEIFGVVDFTNRSADFCPPLGCLHVIDNEHIAHAFNRHGDGTTEIEKGHLPISCADLELVPAIIRSSHIREFSMKGESPRIVYRSMLNDGELVVVQELRRKRGMIVLKTIYKQKK